MKILHIGFQDFGGGAAESMMRIHKSLIGLGFDSNVLVARKKTNFKFTFGQSLSLHHKFIALKREILKKPMEFMFKELKENYFSLNIFPSSIPKQIRSISPDIINLHWINSETLPLYAIKKLTYPVVWTLHDLWPLQGIFHLDKYEVDNNIVKYIDKYILKKKYFFFSNHYFVSPSRYIQKKAYQNSSLNKKRVFCIPNSADEKIFNPSTKNEVISSKILFIGNSVLGSKNKGFDLLHKSCELVYNTDHNLELVVVGDMSSIPKTKYKYLQCPLTNNKEKLVNYYRQASLTVIPSRFENLPLVLLESLASGTPVVAFNVGGIPDVIKHKHNGWLAKPFDIIDFAEGIKFFLDKKKSTSQICRKSILGYTNDLIANKYADLYQNILNKKI